MRDLSSAAVAFSFLYFLVCKTGFAARTPVYRRVAFVGKSALEKLKENPLRPFVIA